MKQNHKQRAKPVASRWRIGAEIQLTYGQRGKIAGLTSGGRVMVDIDGVTRPYLKSQIRLK